MWITDAWIQCLSLLQVATFTNAWNIAIDPGTMAHIMPTPKLPSTSSARQIGPTQTSNVSTPAYFGYDFTVDKNSFTIGAPKTAKQSQFSGIGPRTLKPDSPEATGDILSCPSNNLFGTSSATKCASVAPPQSGPGDGFGQSVGKSPTGDLTACSPTKQQNCSNVIYSPGYCYKSRNGGQTWFADPETRRIKCPSLSLDVMFVLDGSSSVGEANFEIVKSWVTTLSSYFDLKTTQIGVVQYSHYYILRSPDNQPLMKTEVALGSCRVFSCFNESVNKIKLQKWTTNTAHALNKTVNDFKSSRRFSLKTTSKVLILLTDGRSTDSLYVPQSANYVRSLGITTFAVGVGNQINEDELKTIATGDTNSSERVYKVQDFTNLEGIVNQLRNAILTVSLEGGGTSNASDYAYTSELGENGFSNFYSTTAMDQRQYILVLLSAIVLLINYPYVICFNIDADDPRITVIVKKPGTSTNNSNSTEKLFFGHNVKIVKENDSLSLTVTSGQSQVSTEINNKTDVDHKEIYECALNASMHINSSYVTIDARCHGDDHLANENALTNNFGFTTATLSENGEITQKAVCSPFEKQICGITETFRGACYVSNSTRSTKRWIKKVPCARRCRSGKMDLMFVIDGSNSVQLENFKKLKNWTKIVTNGFDLEEKDQVGLVQYSYWSKRLPETAKQPFIKTEISLGQYKNKTLFDQAVDNITYMQMSTYTAHAINKTVNDDFNGNTSRYPAATRVMVLLTDGTASDGDDLPSAVAYANKNDVTSFAVGVGAYNYAELLQIAGSSDRVFTVRKFDALYDIVDRLQQEIQVLESSAAANVTNGLQQCEAGFAAAFGKVSSCAYNRIF